MSDINELIEQIGGRERLVDIKSRIEMYGHGAGYTADEVELMSRALLPVMDAKPFAAIGDEMLEEMRNGRKTGRIWSLSQLGGMEPDCLDALYVYLAPPAASVPDGLAAEVNRLLDSDGSRGTFSAIRRGDALAEVERLLAAAPAPGEN